MDNTLMLKLIVAQLRAGKAAQISVSGISMEPVLYQGDTITIVKQADYAIGDILVFTYKQGELLVHRLLEKKDGKYFCKGDNSFRLEDITPEKIIGKVTAVNGETIKPLSKTLLTLSYLVNRAFLKCKYDTEKAKQTSIYQLYEKQRIGKEVNHMIYKKNKGMDYIFTDETSLAVFDPESGDTHFFDETGIEILNALSDPCDLDMLLYKLCEIYDAKPKDIRADVEEFLNDTLLKKVVEVI